MSAQVRERVLRSEAGPRSVSRIPFGLNPGEVIAAVLAIVLLVSVIVYYFSSLRPEQARLRTLEVERVDQQNSIIANATPGGPDAPVIDQAKTALETLETFKGTHLKAFSSGRIDLIKEINALAKKNSVALTSGIDMGSSVRESSGEGDKARASEKKGNSRRKKADEILSTIPSVAFRFSVFGQYSNLRTFINELEHEKQFLVINSINLANQEARTTSRRSRGEGTGIMLTIEMTAYFQPTSDRTGSSAF